MMFLTSPLGFNDASENKLAIRACLFLLTLIAPVMSQIAFANDAVEEKKVIEKIELLGGRVTMDAKPPRGLVAKVDFSPKESGDNPRFNDKYLHVLEALSQLKSLDLTRTATTDEGLEQVAQLVKLKQLRLGGTQITAAGLKKLSNLTQLEFLDLWEQPPELSAAPTDLSALKAYQDMYPRLTSEAIDQLKAALPNLKIRRIPRAICQPNRNSIGTVGVGSMAETSLRVFMPGKEIAGLKTTIASTKRIRVVRTETKTQQFGEKGDFICHDVFVSIDTSTPGNLNESISISQGDANIEIPISAFVVEPTDTSTRILVVNTPFSRFSTSDDAIFEPWRELVNSAGLVPHYLEAELGREMLRVPDLSKLQVILLADTGLFDAKEKDFAKLKEFAESGGRVVIAANHFFMGTVDKANKFIVPLGLRMSDVERVGEQALIEISSSQLAEHPFTAGIERLKFHRPSPISVEDPEKGTLFVTTDVFPDQGIVAVAKVGKGEVVVLGVSLWWNWIASKQEAGADNAQFLQNLLTKPIPTAN